MLLWWTRITFARRLELAYNFESARSQGAEVVCRKRPASRYFDAGDAGAILLARSLVYVGVETEAGRASPARTKLASVTVTSRTQA